MNQYIVEHKANVPGVKRQPVLWTSPIIVADTAEAARLAFLNAPFGFKPYTEHELIHVRRAA